MTDSNQQPERIALVQEEPVDSRRRIIDAHHHLWGAGQGIGSAAYLHDNLLADIGGHNVIGTVYAENAVAFYEDGPEALRPVGETAFAAAQAKQAVSTRAPLLGIVSFADLSLGDEVQGIIDAHVAAGNGLFRGVRQHCGQDPSMQGSGPARDLLADPAFRDGVDLLGRNGYAFDAFVFYRQLPELAEFVKSVPGTTFVLNHLGVPLNRGAYGTRDEVMAVWRRGMQELAARENVFVKVGGIGLDSLFGMGWSKRETPPTSDEVVAWWGHDIAWCIETFGPSRCMFESNFPVDRWSMSYTVLWNAFQKIAAAYSDDEQDQLFSGTAQAAYRLDLGEG
jgi:predicted TIM-barrel fold metal-dependent hydrolase